MNLDERGYEKMVDEEKQTEENKSENTENNQDRGSEQESSDPVKQANAAAERMEKANQKTQENIKKLQEMEARNILGGKSERQQVEQKKELDPVEYSKRALKGEIPPKEEPKEE